MFSSNSREDILRDVIGLPTSDGSATGGGNNDNLPPSPPAPPTSPDGDGEEPTPIGSGFFGNIYDQFKGKVKEAFDFLLKHRSGDLLGVFHRDDIGDIDLVWGDASKEMGLDHIISKHVGAGKDFSTIEEAVSRIESVIKNGTII